MYELLTKNPCIDVCEFNKKNICKACGRTKQEKKEWKRLDAETRHEIWLRILKTHGNSDKRKARKLHERYKKARQAAARRSHNTETSGSEA